MPQVIEDFTSSSGGERFNKALTEALSKDLNLLLLDEPTNHLDKSNRQSLMRFLRYYQGTLIIVSHDVEILKNSLDIFWHIKEGKVHIFKGSYEDYLREVAIKRRALEQELAELDRQRRDSHRALMKEQSRAKKSRLRGEKHIAERKWPTLVSGTKKIRAAETSGRKKRDISEKKSDVINRLSELRLWEELRPKFSIEASEIPLTTLVCIRDAACGYGSPFLKNIHFSITSHERVALCGDNGSGKTLLVKGLMGDPSVKKSGEWVAPKKEKIGYLDQHYGTLKADETVLETIQKIVPTWSHSDGRRFLNDFLFRKNEEVNARIHTLSGGEKARLSLAQIAVKVPKLLILDELTNNLDLETREHVIQVLQKYPGAMIVISHDEEFLKAIHINRFYNINGSGFSGLTIGLI